MPSVRATVSPHQFSPTFPSQVFSFLTICPVAGVPTKEWSNTGSWTNCLQDLRYLLEHTPSLVVKESIERMPSLWLIWGKSRFSKYAISRQIPSPGGLNRLATAPIWLSISLRVQLNNPDHLGNRSGVSQEPISTPGSPPTQAFV